jgi:NADH-quinone oxidoreductase subunit E
MSEQSSTARAPVATALSPELQAEFDMLRAEYPAEAAPSLVLPLLHCLQAKHGCVTDADAALIARYLDVPLAQVIEAVTWYSMFRRAPAGRHVVKLCRNISCSLRGAERILEHLQQRLGIQPGQTTADGRITLELVECLASCGTAPAMQVNDTYHERLDEARIDRILEGLQ